MKRVFLALIVPALASFAVQARALGDLPGIGGIPVGDAGATAKFLFARADPPLEMPMSLILDEYNASSYCDWAEVKVRAAVTLTFQTPLPGRLPAQPWSCGPPGDGAAAAPQGRAAAAVR